MNTIDKQRFIEDAKKQHGIQSVNTPSMDAIINGAQNQAGSDDLQEVSSGGLIPSPEIQPASEDPFNG